MDNEILITAESSPKKPSGKKIAMMCLSALLGGVFLFSAWTKTEPVAYFEFVISSQLHIAQSMAAMLARFFIGLEAALGLLLIANVFGYKRWVLKACLALLIVFSVHLVYLLVTQGNDVNCGCMGNIAPMSPALSLLKNAAMVAVVIALLKYHRTDDGPVLNVASFPIALIIIAVPFFLFPMGKQIAMPLSKLYSTTESEMPTMELRKGKRILCFMSLGCEHCRKAAGIIQEMKSKNPSLPFYFALASGADSTRAERYADFIQETKAKDIPHHFLAKKDFMDMIKYSESEGVPVILWMEDTTVVRKINLYELNQREIEEWIKK